MSKNATVSTNPTSIQNTTRILALRVIKNYERNIADVRRMIKLLNKYIN